VNPTTFVQAATYLVQKFEWIFAHWGVSLIWAKTAGPKTLSIAATPPVPDMPSAERTVHIPEETAAGIEHRIQGSGFGTVDAFVSFVLARLLEAPGTQPFSEEDERKLKERLRSLGYID
jgi:hypothetical protein